MVSRLSNCKPTIKWPHTFAVCQYYYALLDQIVPLVTVRSTVSLLTEQLCLVGCATVYIKSEVIVLSFRFDLFFFFFELLEVEALLRLCGFVRGSKRTLFTGSSTTFFRCRLPKTLHRVLE